MWITRAQLHYLSSRGQTAKSNYDCETIYVEATKHLCEVIGKLHLPTKRRGVDMSCSPSQNKSYKKVQCRSTQTSFFFFFAGIHGAKVTLIVFYLYLATLQQCSQCIPCME